MSKASGKIMINFALSVARACSVYSVRHHHYQRDPISRDIPFNPV
jgi:hypothetical protein